MLTLGNTEDCILHHGPQGEIYNVDWIVSNHSNVHVANHYKWFTSLTSFKASHHLSLRGETPRTTIFGIGDVELTLEVEPNRTGKPEDQGGVVLHDVCFMPGQPCNIISRERIDDYTYETVLANRRKMVMDSTMKEESGIYNFDKLIRVRLAGQSTAPTYLNHDNKYFGATGVKLCPSRILHAGRHVSWRWTGLQIRTQITRPRRDSGSRTSGKTNIISW